MKKIFLVLLTFPLLCAAQPSISWDAQSLLFDGERVCPVMGEIHYSRLPEQEWGTALRRMKDGGVTVVATYVFWNHIEEEEGVFDWSGQRSLRGFLEACRDADMPVVLRIGPFCHGEVRCGGIPDWMFRKDCKMRSEDPVFLHYMTRLYRQIFTQVQGLQWKDGGPVMACQFDNEYRGHGSYLLSLKRIAQTIGFDLPFYTRTGWPELASPVPFGALIPLYGDYADGFWERSTKETAGNYYKAFNFKAFRSSTAIASEQLQNQQERVTQGDEQYPYFTCELGGGMMVAYHRRPYLYPEDALAMAVVKLGSGSNLLGYYMYHGGTNPESRTGITLQERQATRATNYNDMPVKNYDFQAPLGEFGQTYPHYYTLRPRHLMMHDWGATLAPMEANFPTPQDLAKGDDAQLRWAYRQQGDSAFVFVSNYERLQHLSAKRGVQFEVAGVKFPARPTTIPADCIGVLPVNIDGIQYATAQLVARRDGRIYMMQLPGLPVEMKVDGKVYKNVQPRGTARPVCRNIYLLTKEQAEHLFLEPMPSRPVLPLSFTKVREAGAPRTITLGAQKVAEEPDEKDFDHAAVYRIPVPSHSGLLEVTYRGDVARLYADGSLIADNFYYGRPLLYGLWRLPADVHELELRILPLQTDMPIYFPREADTTPGEAVSSILIR
ncbi:MAG: beta-galactosidase [Bacteroidaceae bacterium]|nr:beta-galactosidase [Bacteroidaceae bacterium]